MGRAVAALPFRVVAVLGGVMVLAQVVLAGAVLDAADGATTGHAGVGGTLIVVAMLQAVLAVPAAWPGGLPGWPVAAAAALVVADIAQVAVGHAGLLAVHVPLGVAIVAGQLVLAGRALLPARRPRPAPVSR
ncbi:hypothetical protein WHI96_17165 [Pseudonocardia tropica]|uniref:Uncharacterized protein n=1 Tax=Pseudonocardia tropica TaxID=681289 RepID=A0ABV1JX55_9PSEU